MEKNSKTKKHVHMKSLVDRFVMESSQAHVQPLIA